VAAGEAEAARIVRGAGPGGTDPRLPALRAGVERLRRELGGYRASLADREVAERQLAKLDSMSDSGSLDEAALRHALLMIAAAVGSVSVLAPAVGQLRDAVESFGASHHRVPAGRPASP
jgi:hypothetical protein